MIPSDVAGDPDVPQIPEFVNVEIAGQTTCTSHFFIDSITPASLMGTILGLIFFLIIHLYIAYRLPPLLSHKAEYFPLMDYDPDHPVDIELSLSSLTLLHRFLQVTGSLLRRRPAARDIDFTFDYSGRVFLKENGTSVNAMSTQHTKITLHFTEGAQWTQSFPIFAREISDYDGLLLKMTFSGDLDSIEGISFSWCYANPSATKGMRLLKTLMSAVIGYISLVYLSFLADDFAAFAELSCIILGALGVFASNPLAWALPPAPGGRMSDFSMMAIFVAFWRFFCLAQIEFVRSKTDFLNVFTVIPLALFFVVYCLLEIFVTFSTR
jgi:hypothetical protein